MAISWDDISFNSLVQIDPIKEDAIVLNLDQMRVLRNFLRRLTCETGWLNDKWLDDADVHEIAIIHEISQQLNKIED